MILDWDGNPRKALDLLNELFECDQNAVVLGCSVESDSNTIQEAMRIGCTGFITKPFQENSLVNKIDICLSEKKKQE